MVPKINMATMMVLIENSFPHPNNIPLQGKGKREKARQNERRQSDRKGEGGREGTRVVQRAWSKKSALMLNQSSAYFLCAVHFFFQPHLAVIPGRGKGQGQGMKVRGEQTRSDKAKKWKRPSAKTKGKAKHKGKTRVKIYLVNVRH